jgi:hypothetical protein
MIRSFTNNKLTVISMLLCCSVSYGDCTKSLGLCEDFTKAQDKAITDLQKEVKDLSSNKQELEKALIKSESTGMPKWAIFAIGALAGAVLITTVKK